MRARGRSVVSRVITWATSDRSNSTFSWFTWDLAGFSPMLPGFTQLTVARYPHMESFELSRYTRVQRTDDDARVKLEPIDHRIYRTSRCSWRGLR
jgi:hypothetical protein